MSRLGPTLNIPLLANRNMRVTREYGCLIEDKGSTFHASYLIDPKGVLRLTPWLLSLHWGTDG